MTSKINLYNRDGADIWLERIGNSDIYKLKWNERSDDYMRYMRYGYDENPSTGEKTIVFIDPPGGPYMSVGSQICDGVVITSITATGDDWILVCEKSDANDSIVS